MRKILLALLSLAIASSVGARDGDRDSDRQFDTTDCLYYPNLGNALAGPITTTTTQTIDAAGEMSAWSGKLASNDDSRSAHTCSSSGCNIQFMTSTGNTWADSTTSVTIGLQDTSTSAGPPTQPDETWTNEPRIAITPTGGANPVTISNTTWTTATIGTGSRSLTPGDQISIVADMTARGGTDALVFRLLSPIGSPHLPASSLKTASWAATNGALPNVLITTDDGTLFWLEGSRPGTNTTSLTANTGTTPDELALNINLPFNYAVDALWMLGSTSAAADYSLVFYSDPYGTPVAEKTVTIDGGWYRSNVGGVGMALVNLPTVFWGTANRNYAVSVLPTSANSVAVAGVTVSDNAHLAAWAGTNNHYITRSDGSGAFSRTSNTTTMPFIGIRACRLRTR